MENFLKSQMTTNLKYRNKSKGYKNREEGFIEIQTTTMQLKKKIMVHIEYFRVSYRFPEQ